MRAAMKKIRAQVPGADRVVVCGETHTIECVFVWYWLNEGDRVSWNYRLPPADRVGDQLWGFHQGPGADAACHRLQEELLRRDPAWHVVRRIAYAYAPRNRKETPERCELFCFAPSL